VPEWRSRFVWYPGDVQLLTAREQRARAHRSAADAAGAEFLQMIARERGEAFGEVEALPDAQTVWADDPDELAEQIDRLLAE
jgi:hypothetical protein